MRNLRTELQNRAQNLGFGGLWVTDAATFSAWEQARRARSDGFGASLEADPRAILPSARSVVVLAYPYRDEPERVFPLVRVSPYYLASHKAHHAVSALADWLREGGWQAAAQPSLPAKAAALRAGAGRYGRNGLLLTEEHGGNVALALLLTDAELPIDAKREPACESNDLLSSKCQGCSACVNACPVGALDGTSAVDTARCLRAHMFSNKPVPEAYRAAMGNRLLGCDECRTVCPQNACAGQNTLPPEAFLLSLDALLTSDASRREAFRAIEKRVGSNYARLHRVLAQAALLAGNSGDDRYLPALAPLCESEHGPLREHACWATEFLRVARKL